MTAGTIEVDEFVPHPPAAVWEALTDADQLGRWFMASDFRAELGRRFTLQTQRWGRTECVVTALAPPSTLAYSWRNGPLDTLVTWRLVAEGRGTRVLVEHAGFDLDDPEQRAAFNGMRTGWPGIVARRLPAHLGGAGAPLSGWSTGPP